MKKPTITINTGEVVLLEEFNRWKPQTQWARTIPIEEFNAKFKDRQAPSSRAVNTPKGQFPSMRAAAKAHGVSEPTIRGYLHNEAYPDFNFVDKSHLDTKSVTNNLLQSGRKATSTPNGLFPSKIEAARAYGLTKGQFERLMQREPTKYFYLSDGINKRKRIVKA